MNVQKILARTHCWMLVAGILVQGASLAHSGEVAFRTGEALVDVRAKADATGTFVIGGGTIGWSFTVVGDSGIIVTSLGYYDLNGDGLGEEHKVGIWDDEDRLIGSATVLHHAPLLNGFRYAAVTAPFVLGPDRTYVIGAYHTENVDNYLSSYGRAPLDGFSTDPDILYEGSRISFGPDFVQPTLTTGVIGRIGPNFQFQSAVATPEPSAALLLSLGLAGFGAMVRRRARTTA